MNETTFTTRFLKWSPIMLLGLLFVAIIHFNLFHYLHIHALRRYQVEVVEWSRTHYKASVSIYMLAFMLLIACAIPCATLLTLIGGFLYGGIATIYAVLATTAGGALLYLAVRTAFGAKITARKNRKKTWASSFEMGLRQDAFHYLLMLRLIPIFPCWFSNISAGVLRIPFKTFFFATLIGITPSTFIYAMAGRGLDKLVSSGHISFSHIILTPSILFPLLGLAFLSILPVLYKYIKKSDQNS